MKKLFILGAVTALLAGCSDETPTPFTPEPGSDITFAISLGDSPQSRTIYGDETTIGGVNAFPIYWVNKDQIIVASPQCATGRNVANYEVTATGDQDRTASAVNKTGEAGVQWGSTAPADCYFYSVYPTSYYTAPNEQPVVNKVQVNGTTATATLNVRQYQRNLFTKVGNVWKGTPIDSRSLNPETANLNTKNPDALMYAQTKGVNTDNNVELIYKPFTVAFNITLDGYTLNTDLGTTVDGVTIQEVTIEAPSGTKLVGNFDATFSTNLNDVPTVSTAGNKLETANIIHIPTITTVDGAYLKIATGESVNFNVFAIPTNNTVTSAWKLTVRTPNGTYSRPLTPGSGANAGQLIAGQMHKLKMPTFQINQQVTLPPATWMERIPRNVYLSELSVPGAWYAGVTEYQSTTDFSTMWNAGVRAYAVETRSSVSSRFVNNRNHVVISGTGDNSGSLTENKYVGGTPIANVMSTLIEQLQRHKTEYAVLVLSYADGGSGGHNAEDYEYWLGGIYAEYNSLTDTQKQFVYGYNQGETITPNTIVSDVLGKLIIKVNCGSGLGDNHSGAITIGGYQNNIPGLLSYTDQTWDSSSLNKSLVSQMYWKSWADDYMVNAPLQSTGDIANFDANNLYWNYTLANRTQPDNGTNTTLPKYENRKASIQTILANSRTMYLSGKNNIWYFIGAGGTQASQVSGGTTSATNFASNMNQFILDQLNNKLTNNDFSPFGIVMCNFITNATYHGPDIIAKILQMNTEFRLNRDENQPEWPNGTQSLNENQFGSVATNAGDAWVRQ